MHRKKFRKVMREFKERKLKSGSGNLVTDKDQAIAIAIAESKKEKKKHKKRRSLTSKTKF